MWFLDINKFFSESYWFFFIIKYKGHLKFKCEFIEYFLRKTLPTSY